MALLSLFTDFHSLPPHRERGSAEHGGSVIAFIEDPDGYKIELIERSASD